MTPETPTTAEEQCVYLSALITWSYAHNWPCDRLNPLPRRTECLWPQDDRLGSPNALSYYPNYPHNHSSPLLRIPLLLRRSIQQGEPAPEVHRPPMWGGRRSGLHQRCRLPKNDKMVTVNGTYVVGHFYVIQRSLRWQAERHCVREYNSGCLHRARKTFEGYKHIKDSCASIHQ